MGKGKATRQRIKRATVARDGNLYALQFGKALPSNLPEPPKEEDMTDKLPKSLQRLLQLKEVAEARPKRANPVHKPQKRKAVHEDDGTDAAQTVEQGSHDGRVASSSSSEPVQAGFSNGRSAMGSTKPTHAGRADSHEVSQAGHATGPSGRGSGAAKGQDVLRQELLEKKVTLTRKQAKRKEHLKQKKLKKKGKLADVDNPQAHRGPPPGGQLPTSPAAKRAGQQRGASSGSDAGPSRLVHTAKQPALPSRPVKTQQKDIVRFGEVVDRPLEINLKRRHWTGEAKSAGQRCKEVLLKQLSEAQARMDPSRRALVESSALMKAHAASGGVPARATKKPKLQGAEQEAVRLQAIEAYRQQKGAKSLASGVSTQSLKDLVARNSARPVSYHALS